MVLHLLRLRSFFFGAIDVNFYVSIKCSQPSLIVLLTFQVILNILEQKLVKVESGLVTGFIPLFFLGSIIASPKQVRADCAGHSNQEIYPLITFTPLREYLLNM